MQRSDRRHAGPPMPPPRPERPAGVQTMTPEQWARMVEAIRRLAEAR